MNILILGRGKTGSLVAETALKRRHNARSVGAAENSDRASLMPDKLHDVEVVMDFTTPASVIPHIEACADAGKNMVIGTTGWYGDLDRARKIVERHGIGLI